LIPRFIRYAGVGAIGTVVHYAILIGLVQGLSANAIVASTAGFVIAALVNYALHREFTFASERAHRVAMPRFFTFAGTGVLVNGLVMGAILDVLPVHYLFAQVVATGVVLVTGFLANRRWTF
jgi:putative flippase GtrA